MSENQSSPSLNDQQDGEPPQRQLAPASSVNFVFGQNLEDRVILPASSGTSTTQPVANDTASAGQEDGKDGEQEAQASHSHASPVASTSSEDTSSQVRQDNGTTTTTTTTIAPAIGAGAAAAKDAAALIQKRKYEATIVTGEEDESNVLQIHCKLYSWVTEESVWKEKGKGFLKLNDKKNRDDRLSSRLSKSHSVSLAHLHLNSSIHSHEDVWYTERHPQLFPGSGHEFQQKFRHLSQVYQL